MNRMLGIVAAVAILCAAALLASAGVTLRAGALGADLPPSEARALAVEQQLLCPQCTNKRLDACEIEICQDMRREIRTRLQRGESEQDVLGFFAGRYGDRILAAVPKSGFPLWLWAWVGGSVLAVAFSGTLWLRAHGRPPAVEGPYALDDADERWLDTQLSDASRPRAEG